MKTFDKIPPQAIDEEEAVLGALLIEKDAILRLPEQLLPCMMYKDANRIILEAVMALFKAAEPIDLITVKNKVQKMGKLEQIGGALALVALTNRIASAAHIEAHAQIVIEKYELREAITRAMQVMERAYQDDATSADVIPMLQQFSPVDRAANKNWQQQLRDSVKRMEHAAAATGTTGVASSLIAVNDALNGYQKSDLIILAARPGMGKSAFALQEFIHAAKSGLSCAFFSLEMGDFQLIDRALSAEADMNLYLIKNPREFHDYEWKQINNTVAQMYDYRITLDDTPAIDLTYMRRALIKHRNKYNGLDVVFVDYLQLMREQVSKGGSREQEISAISRGLKAIAKEFNVPVISLSQLSRGVESRTDKRPMLSDLRESGAIEQDADVVMFLYRPDYYGITQSADGSSLDGICEVIIAKHRNGSTGTEEVLFDGNKTKFANLKTFTNFEPGF